MKLCPVCQTEYPDSQKFCPNDGSALKSLSPVSDLVGQVIAERYHVIKKLGEGGMGQVYLAEHVKMGRKSAIKVMNPGMVQDPDAISRFNREASNASRITHPNVCAIYDFGETPDGVIYLAMEFIEGGALTDLVEREGPLPPPRAAKILHQVADALQAAHDLGIVHRDLKPDNIMIVKGRDGSDVVKVVDFGIAKAVGGDQTGQKVTKTGLVVGTPEYMSPEQLAGDKLDGRSDIYSLGLVCFRMLAGKLPFQAETSQEIMIKRLTDEPMKLAEALPGRQFSPALQEALDKALTRMPGERYASAAQFGKDVVRAVEGMAPAGVDSAATQLLEAAAAPAPSRAPAGAQTAVAPTRVPATKKRSLVPIVVGAVVLLGGGGAAAVIFGGGGGGNGGTGTQLGDSSQQGGPQPQNDRKTGTSTPPGGQTGNQQRTQALGQRGTNPQSGGTTPPSGVDSAAIDRELGQLIEQIFDPATLAAARQRATQVYDNETLPRILRAQAAFIVSQSFFGQQNNDAACRWNDRALSLAPGRDSYVQFKREHCP